MSVTLEFLLWLQNQLTNNDRTNLQELCSWFGVDANLATVLKEIEIVKKVDGFWEWIVEEPDEEMATLVRETANQYKNYAY